MSNASEPNQQFCLKWNNHHSNMLNVFETLLHSEAFTDVTLAVDGASIRCHKMVLAACSGYFHNLFAEHVASNVIVVLKDVRPAEMRCLLEYMYRGEVHVAQEQFTALLSVAESLQIKGLVEEGRRERERASQNGVASGASSDQGPSAIETDQHVSVTETTHQSHANSLGSPVSALPPPAPAQLEPLVPPPGSGQAALPLGSLDGGVEMSGSALPTPDLPKRRRKTASSGTGQELWYENNPILRTVLGHGGVSGLDVSALMAAAMRREFIDRECADRQVMSSTGSEENHAAPEPLASEPELDKMSNGSVGEVTGHWDPNLPNYMGNYMGFAPSGMRPEWKRYKQYSKSDLQQALDAVKGGMTALQASRKFHVPSRTLYDKIKKLGIPTTPRRYPRSPGAPLNVSPVSLFPSAASVATSILCANGDAPANSRDLQPMELVVGRRGERHSERAHTSLLPQLAQWPKAENRDEEVDGGSDGEVAGDDPAGEGHSNSEQRQPMELVVEKRRLSSSPGERRSDTEVSEFHLQWPKEEATEDSRELDVVA
nr:BR-like protein [Parasacculina yatsui]